MLRAMCIGVGVFMILLGLSLHGIDSYTVRPSATAKATGMWYGPLQPEARTVTPEPWKPWVYLGAGTVLILWTFTLPTKMKGK
jgi:hypothetical protein